jgi:hypothetical protein
VTTTFLTRDLRFCTLGRATREPRSRVRAGTPRAGATRVPPIAGHGL